MGFGASTPSAPLPPPPPPVPAQAADSAVQQAGAQSATRLAAASGAGFGGTIDSGPGGSPTTSETTAPKQLLGY